MDSTTYTSNFKGNQPDGKIECHCQPSTVARLVRATREISRGSLIVELTNQIDQQVLQRLAECPYANERILATLAFNPSTEVRQAVADNARSSCETLMLLAHDEDVDVRYQLAENHNIPEGVLIELTDDENPYISCRAESTLVRKRMQWCSIAA